ncbi:STAS/SEC14 domain-containing protein [Arthrobacter sp. SD76]|uniref:STAS/SEC14 domain-containing protein n=1 Tax=Arthrobacter sp. SD76 TaxID=3415007 RepID=UPI003C78AD4D
MAEVNTMGEQVFPLLVDMANADTCAAYRVAFLYSSPVDQLIANFFLQIPRPPYQSHFFASRAAALA